MAANQCRPFSFPRNSITSQDHVDVRSADAPGGVLPVRRLRGLSCAYLRRISSIRGFDASFVSSLPVKVVDLCGVAK
jgi:hypothetical protein